MRLSKNESEERTQPEKPPDRQLTVRKAVGEEEKKNRGGTVRRERCGESGGEGKKASVCLNPKLSGDVGVHR